MRKKISTNVNSTAAIADLDDDEEFVEEVTTTKRVGRQRRIPNAELPIGEIVVDKMDADDGQFIDIDDDGEPIEPDRPKFSESSIAALVFSDDGEDLDSQYCTIAIRRKPDSMNDRFLTPCGAVTNLPPLRNVELSADRMDIEDRVRSEYGGGHYFFQIHYDNRLRASWQSTLSDDPAAVAASRAASMPAEPAPAAVPVDPITAFLDNIERQKRMKELLFGDQEADLKAQIADLKLQIERGQATPPQPQSEQLVILEKALSAGNNPELQDRLLNYAFPADESGNRHWIAELADVALQNKDTILGLLGGLLGAPPQPQPEPPPLADLFRQPMPGPSGPAPAAVEAGFRRRQIDAEHAAETPDEQPAEGPDVPIQAFIDQPLPIELVPIDDEQPATDDDQPTTDKEPHGRRKRQAA